MLPTLMRRTRSSLACLLPRSSETRRTLLWGVLAGIAALGSWGCERGAEPVRQAARPNVILVVIDTLGAEHLGCQGVGLDLSPHIDGLAAGGRRFARGYSTAPWTKPSVASIFTSKLPSRHGVQSVLNRLSADQETLAEDLQQAGYRTHGIISHVLIHEQHGYAQGFQGWDASPMSGHAGISDEKVSSRALEWLEDASRERDTPFFLFLHYFDPHYFYQDHPEFDLTGDYAGDLVGGMDIHDLRQERDALRPEDVAYLEALYHEEIAFTDLQIGRLLDGLERLGLADDTLVVLTADHGEEFMEHGWLGHTQTLYDELLHVPLILRWPGVIEPGVVEAPASTLDILPTLAELLGLPRDPRWAGESLVPWLRGTPPPERPRDLFAEVDFAPLGMVLADDDRQQAFLSSLMRGRWKLIHDRLRRSWELYDLESDPDELDNRIGHDPDLDEQLKNALLREEHFDFIPPTREDMPGPTEAELRELDALGYGR